MDEIFYGFLKPSRNELISLWDNCTFTFDANSLLNLYRYSEDTYQSFSQALESVSDKIWLPYKAADEYFRNRIGVATQQLEIYKALNNRIIKFEEDIADLLAKHKEHKSLNSKSILTRVKRFTASLNKSLSAQKEEHPNIIKDDSVLNFIIKLFRDNVGSKIDQAKLDKIYADGKIRYAEQIPPGYKDNSKDTNYKRYGDLIIWNELIDYSISNKTNLIFVTDDRKEDWWQINGSLTIGPRPELIQEFYDITKKRIHIYTPTTFVKIALERDNKVAPQNVLKEIEDTPSNSDSRMTNITDSINALNQSTFILNKLVKDIKPNLVSSGPHEFTWSNDSLSTTSKWIKDTSQANKSEILRYILNQLLSLDSKNNELGDTPNKPTDPDEKTD